jgi:reactive intermediate/imine deaminase
MAAKKLIHTENVKSAGGRPYSPALRVGDILYASGQVPIDGEGKTIGAGDPVVQGRQCLNNIKELIQEAGGTMDDIVFLTIYVTDMRHFHTFSEVRKEFFTPPYPASTAVGVTGLAHEDWLIEIEGTAHLSP